MPNGHLNGIVGKFYREELKLHKEELIELEDTLTKDMKVYVEYVANGINFDGRLKLSKLLLRQTITRFYYDVIKFQHFHGFYDFTPHKKINNYKKTAMLTNWLIKFKPIQIIDQGKGSKNNIFATVVNQYFAVDWSLNSVKIYPGIDNELLPSLKNTKERMIYNFCHRDFNIPFYVHFLENVFATKVSNLKIEELIKELDKYK